jgi:hypothetical protein
MGWKRDKRSFAQPGNQTVDATYCNGKVQPVKALSYCGELMGFMKNIYEKEN